MWTEQLVDCGLIVIAILGKHYWWNSSYWRLEHYWVTWLCVHSSPIIELLFDAKIGNFLHRIFYRKFPNCGLKIQKGKYENAISKKYNWL